MMQQMQQMQQNQDISLKGVVGIQNMGNTCYCNTTLQLLRASSDWNMICLTKDFSGLKPDSNQLILLAYQDIIKSIWSAYKPAYVRPIGFLTEVRKAVQGTVYESFGLPIPHDSHEYLVYLLDHFHEALKKPTIIPIQPIPEDLSPTERMTILAENGWNRFVSENESEMTSLFFGMMRKTIECMNCHNKTYQWEVFNSLKIPCEGSTFQEWIRGEVNESCTIETYQCNGCNGRHDATKKSHLWKLPKNLFITLRRFQYHGKNMTPCPYDGGVLSFREFYAEEVNELDKNKVYELRGVSDHHGTHMGGHYTAQFKHPISNEWWHIDDEMAHSKAGPLFSASNYIFLFSTR